MILATVLSVPISISIDQTPSEPQDKQWLGQADNFLYEFPVSCLCSLPCGHLKMVPTMPTLIPMGLSVEWFWISLHSTTSPSDLWTGSVRISLSIYSICFPKPIVFTVVSFTFACVLLTLKQLAGSAETTSSQAGTSYIMFNVSDYLCPCDYFTVSVLFLTLCSMFLTMCVPVFILLSIVEFQWISLVSYLTEKQSSHFLNLGLKNYWGVCPSSNPPSSLLICSYV